MTKTTTYHTIAGLRRAMRKLPKEASAKLRDASEDIAVDIATKAQALAELVGGVASLVSPTIRPSRDRVPIVKMGSSAKLPESGNGWTHKRTGKGQTIGDVIWGAEFGGGVSERTRQFMPHLGQVGYFLWPTVRGESDAIMDRYSGALLDALEATR